jgi:DNA-binding transcriptional ArsR family regulator
MPFENFIDQPKTPAVRFEIEPAINAFETLLLMSKGYELPGVASWVFDTVQSLSKTERETNKLVTLGLHYASLPEPGWSSFPSYLDHIESLEATALRDKMLDAYDNQPPMEGSGPLLTRQQALESVDQYLAYLRQRFWAANVDEPLERKAFKFVSDPPAMQQLIVEHLRSMWQKHLSAEWERVRPMLLESVRAFRHMNLHGMTLLEAANIVADRELPTEKWKDTFQPARRVLFIPNAHIGPYLFQIRIQIEEPIILFGARLPNYSNIDVPDLSRTEAVMRLSALADDTRLRILRLAAERGELRSQEIMETLDLSQPATSRHLTQLAATGYLKERRCDGAKCYTLNPVRISETFQGLSNFLLMGERSRI